MDLTQQHQDSVGDLAVPHPKGILKYQAQTECHFHSRSLLDVKRGKVDRKKGGRGELDCRVL
jgi:hypothetical protein